MDVSSLSPRYSTDRAHANSMASAKKYRWHLSSLDGRWVVWSSWGPYHSPDRSRSFIGESADIYAAAAIMQRHIDSKSRRKREPYLSYDETPVRIDDQAIEQLAFAQL